MSSYPCPFCRAVANLESGCPGCGRPPDANAAEVIRLADQIVEYSARAERAGQEHTTALGLLHEAQRRHRATAARVRAAVHAQTAPAQPPGWPALELAHPEGVRPNSALSPGERSGQVRPEASTRTVQNVLFVLGGLLLGTAAIVFTAVAWATFGQGGRAVILAGFTGLALGAPLLALRRGLVATAETFAVVGLLLVVLDGYAAWHVNLFGVAGGSARAYAGAVCVVTAVIAAGYGAATGLVGPGLATLVAAQPALPLLVAPFDPSPTGWSLTFLAVGAVDVAVVWWLRGRSGTPAHALQVSAWVAYGCALAVSGVCALAALVTASGPGATAGGGAALVAAALLLVVGALVARFTLMQAAAGATLVVALALAGGRFVAVTWESLTGVLVAAVAAVLAVAVAGTARLLPRGVRPGPWLGALTVAGCLGLIAVTVTLVAAIGALAGAQPAFHADLSTRAGPHDWQLLAALALLTAALVVLLPRAVRVEVALGGGTVLVLALPAATALPWWAPSAIDLAAAAVLAVLAVRARTAAYGTSRAAIAALLSGHAILAGLGRPGSTAAVLGAIVLLGAAVAALGRRMSTVEGMEAHPRIIGGGSLTVGLLAWPGALAAALVALRVEPWWVARATVAAGAVLVLALFVVGRSWPAYRWYAFAAALGGAFLDPLWADVGTTDEASGSYAAVALLLIGVTTALVLRPKPEPAIAGRHGVSRPMPVPAVAAAWIAAAVPALWWAVAVVPAAWAVLMWPYSWLTAIWSGRPAGVGLLSGEPALAVAGADAVALGLAVIAVVVPVAVRFGLRVAFVAGAPVAAVALLTGLAAAGARWPSVAAVSLALGLGYLLAAALGGGGRAVVAVPAGLLLAGAGLAGAVPTKGTTLGALGLTVVVAVAAGAAGRTLAARLAGWLAAVAAGFLLAVAAGLAAGLAARTAAFGALAVAAAALALGTAMRARRPVESMALQAAAHAGAGVALLLTAGAIRYAAAVCTLWGVVLGLRALWPGESGVRRRGFVVIAAGVELLAWWLLIAAEQVALVEAYTLPAAGVALLAGWIALRGRGLGSWVTYGPALGAGLLPSLATVFASDGQPARRLLLGAATLAVVLAGAAWRLQAPVVVGGAVLVLVALHELLLVWDLLPRWIPLAAGGLLLVGLAMTLERRRRDLGRLRHAVARMS